MYITFSEISPTEMNRYVRNGSGVKDDTEKVSMDVDEAERYVRKYHEVIETGKACLIDARQLNGKDPEVTNRCKIFENSFDLLKFYGVWWSRFY